jgi:hypothetical protein
MADASIDRRRILELLGAAAFVPWPAHVTPAMPALAAVDHLLLGAADLDHGVRWVEERTGVRPVIGGTHPGRGTRNALLALGDKRYLEVIAPDPAQTTYTFQIDVRTLKEPRLITWAAGSTDIDALARRAKTAGRNVFGPSDGSRARPDGKLLRWRALGVPSGLAANGVEPIPFFIQWAADSVHPSTDSPGGCALTAFRIAHPDPGAVRDLLAAYDIEANVEASAAAALHAALTTPTGVLELR